MWNPTVFNLWLDYLNTIIFQIEIDLAPIEKLYDTKYKQGNFSTNEITDKQTLKTNDHQNKNDLNHK